MSQYHQIDRRDRRLGIPELNAGMDLLRHAPASCAVILGAAAMLGFGIGWLANL